MVVQGHPFTDSANRAGGEHCGMGGPAVWRILEAWAVLCTILRSASCPPVGHPCMERQLQPLPFRAAGVFSCMSHVQRSWGCCECKSSNFAPPSLRVQATGLTGLLDGGSDPGSSLLDMWELTPDQSSAALPWWFAGKHLGDERTHVPRTISVPQHTYRTVRSAFTPGEFRTAHGSSACCPSMCSRMAIVEPGGRTASWWAEEASTCNEALLRCRR